MLGVDLCYLFLKKTLCENSFLEEIICNLYD